MTAGIPSIHRFLAELQTGQMTLMLNDHEIEMTSSGGRSKDSSGRNHSGGRNRRGLVQQFSFITNGKHGKEGNKAKKSPNTTGTTDTLMSLDNEHLGRYRDDLEYVVDEDRHHNHDQPHHAQHSHRNHHQKRHSVTSSFRRPRSPSPSSKATNTAGLSTTAQRATMALAALRERDELARLHGGQQAELSTRITSAGGGAATPARRASHSVRKAMAANNGGGGASSASAGASASLSAAGASGILIDASSSPALPAGVHHHHHPLGHHNPSNSRSSSSSNVVDGGANGHGVAIGSERDYDFHRQHHRYHGQYDQGSQDQDHDSATAVDDNTSTRRLAVYQQTDIFVEEEYSNRPA